MTKMAHGTKFSEKQLERLAAEHEAETDVEGEEEGWTYDDGSAEKGTATISIRLPKSVIAELKRQAEDQDVGATVLARRWIIERLAGETNYGVGEPAVVDAGELLEFVMTRARPVRDTGVIIFGHTGEHTGDPATEWLTYDPSTDVWRRFREAVATRLKGSEKSQP
jgi:hypothetical protein